MATQYAFGQIIKDGLAISLDASDRNSYPGSGTSYLDISGNGNTGTLTNGPTFSSENGGVIVFDGTNDYISVPNSTSVNVSGNITMEAVVKRNTSAGGVPIHKDYQYSIIIYTNGAISYADSSNWCYACFSNFGSIAANRYHHIIATKSGSLVTIYVNNSVLVSQNFGGALSQTSNPLYIGSYAGSSEYFNGNIAISRVYNRAFSAADVLQNYNAIKTRYSLL